MQSLQPEILQNKGTKRQLHFLDNIISSIYMENKMKNEKKKKKKTLDDCIGLCVCQIIQVVT